MTAKDADLLFFLAKELDEIAKDIDSFLEVATLEPSAGWDELIKQYLILTKDKARETLTIINKASE